MPLANDSLFISYRDNTGDWASMFADRLRDSVGVDAVFLDNSNGEPPGTAWPNQTKLALSQCRVFLPVITPAWHHELNISLLKEPEDWVHRELISAWERRERIARIPIFVNDAAPLDPELFRNDPQLWSAVADLMCQSGFHLDRNPELWGDNIDALLDRIESETSGARRQSISTSTTATPGSVSGTDVAGSTRSTIDIDDSITIDPENSSETKTTETHSSQPDGFTDYENSSVSRRGVHAFLNSRQGLLTLIGNLIAVIGVFIAAIALWDLVFREDKTPVVENAPTSKSPKPVTSIEDTSGKIGNRSTSLSSSTSSTSSPPSIYIGKWTGKARGPLMEYAINLTLEPQSSLLEVNTAIAQCDYRLSLIETTENNATFDARLVESRPTMACSSNDIVELTANQKDNKLNYISQDSFGNMNVSGLLERLR